MYERIDNHPVTLIITIAALFLVSWLNDFPPVMAWAAIGLLTVIVARLARAVIALEKRENQRFG